MVSAALYTSASATDVVWQWLEEVPDPEIPVVSVVDLGIVRDVRWCGDAAAECVITVTPTYSGCPATEVIGRDIAQALRGHGLLRVRLEVQLSPAWTTDWLSTQGREKLRVYGISPPGQRAAEGRANEPQSLVVLGRALPAATLICPRCGSAETETISRFGSTPCKSLHRCLQCREPFDHFKCH